MGKLRYFWPPQNIRRSLLLEIHPLRVISNSNLWDRAASDGRSADLSARVAQGATLAEVLVETSQSKDALEGQRGALVAWVRAQGTDNVIGGGVGYDILTGRAMSLCSPRKCPLRSLPIQSPILSSGMCWTSGRFMTWMGYWTPMHPISPVA